MAPKQTAGSTRGHGKERGNKRRSNTAAPEPPESSNPFESSSDERPGAGGGRRAAEVADEEGPAEVEKTIPRELLTRVLHEFFAKDATRISRDANAAVGKYVDVFVREAIARAAVEKKGGFLEVRGHTGTRAWVRPGARLERAVRADAHATG